MARLATAEDLVAPRWERPNWSATLPLVGLEEDRVWREYVVDLLPNDLSQNANVIANYAFTEMLNNAIDHSGGREVAISLWAGNFDVRFEIRDWGAGAFPHVQERLGLEDLYDALGELVKGKTTTDRSRHTGEGIFFTSKAVDVYTLESGGLRWTVDNLRNDQAVGGSDVTEGTRVRWEIDPAGSRSLAEVFQAYYTDDDYQFDKTKTVVHLFGIGVRFISRSEAKRLMRGLERFREVELDFTGVEDVGQGFVDEVFRVWPQDHDGTLVTPTGMSGPVEFMVRRGLPSPPQGGPRPE